MFLHHIFFTLHSVLFAWNVAQICIRCKLKMMHYATCRDEAARIWQQRESEWERERLAREQLMQEVSKTVFNFCADPTLVYC